MQDDVRYIGGPSDGEAVSGCHPSGVNPLFVFIPDRKGAKKRTQERDEFGKWRTTSLEHVPTITYRKETHYHYVEEG